MTENLHKHVHSLESTFVTHFLKLFLPQVQLFVSENSYVCLCALGNDTRRGPFRKWKSYL